MLSKIIAVTSKLFSSINALPFDSDQFSLDILRIGNKTTFPKYDSCS
ncbi:hypothetical protein LEP1GSC192_0750 [Leptospira sp. B5-022]|nr:hypothetical protein LEP1GSC192_0750 [Leptospira sp. B5-022]